MSLHDTSFDRLDTTGFQDDDLKRELGGHALTLSPDEARRVQELLGRAPTITELTLFDTMWSEHCSYKSSKPTLKEFLPTDASNVIVGPVEDAGIVDFGTVDGVRYGIIFAHESHNHPSQVMPVEGAATGIGGIVRDVYCMGGEVIGTLDPLRFGWPEGPKGEHSIDIAREVVTGIWEYGNALGVPNLGGDVYFHPSYDDNCLVNVVALGIVPADHITHSRVPVQAQDEPYDLILVGKPTDWSGMGGAAFASATLDAAAAKENKGSVQVPDPFLKRVLTVANKAVLELARERGAVVGFKDLGAGGVSCVTSELADAGGFGCDVDLALVHAVADCPARVIACSETQERYSLAVPRWFTDDALKVYNEDFALPSLYEGACARKVGVVTTDGMYRLHHGDLMAAEAPIETITCGVSYQRVEGPEASRLIQQAKPAEVDESEIAEEWVRLLGHPNVASREHLYRHYDPEVRGCTVLRPGEADAGVVAPVPGSSLGVAVSADGNPLMGLADSYHAGARAVIEAARNVACVGGRPAAITDCLNFGNPEVPAVFRQFREAVRGVGDACRGLTLHARGGEALPVVSGNVSFYNQSASGKTVAPSPIVACIANVADIAHCRSSHFKAPGDRLLLIGLPDDGLGASLSGEAGLTCGRSALPELDFDACRREIDAVCTLVEHGLVQAAHDVSDGGLAVTLAEMALGLEGQCSLGAAVRIPEACADLTPREFLYGERGGFIVEVRVDDVARAEEILASAGCAWALLGEVTDGETLTLTRVDGSVAADVAVDELEVSWREGLTRILATRSLPDLADRQPPRADWDDDPTIAAPAVLTGAKPRLAVLQLPGMNCEEESARAILAGGGAAEIYRWTRPAADLEKFDGFLVPGGFSYQDRVRAGAVAAKDPLLGALQKASAAGKPILGICNGCQVLIEGGLVPAREGIGHVEVALAPNRIAGRRGYYSRWVVLEPVPGNCCQFLEGWTASIPVPIAHAEGRFTHEDPAVFATMVAEGLLALRYAGVSQDGRGNPNGSLLATAALTNPAGNVLAMMPHPERAAWLFQVPEDLDHPWGKVRREAAGNAAALQQAGPGMALIARLIELC